MKLGFEVRSVLPAQDCIELARQAEKKGYDSVWFSEGYGHKDAVSLLTAAALATSRITVGSSIMVVYLRHPILMGMTAMGVSELANGRFALGLGTGHADQLAQVYGLSHDRPVRWMREYVEVVRLALEGRESSYPGEVFRIQSYHSRISYERPSQPVPIFLGVLNEKMLRLAGRVADGVLLAYAPTSYVRQARAWVAEGARRAGRDPATVTIGAVVPAAVSSDGASAEAALRRQVAYYAAFPDTNRMLRAGGYGQALDAVGQALERRDWKEAGQGLPEGLVAEIGVAGTPTTCRRTLQRFADAGLDLMVLLPITLPGREEARHHADVLEALGR